MELFQEKPAGLMKKFYILFSPLAVVLCCLNATLLSAQPLDAGKLTPPLLMEMEAAPDAYYRAYALLAGRLDPREMEAEFRRDKLPLQQRAYELITALRARAAATQPPLLARMERMEGIRKESLQPFWITSIIFFEGRRDAIAALSRDPAVARLGLNEQVEIEGIDGQACPSEPMENNAERGLQAIGAPQMWAMGYTGYGRRALIVDTGQDPGHPALNNQFLYHYRDIDEAWAGNSAPEDCDSHGSHVTGTIVGIDRVERDTIGVAFDGKWMGGIALGGGCSAGADIAGITSMFQWAIDPDGNPATIDDMPDVINNSWRSGSGFCDENGVFEVYDALYAAGIAVVFSAGNDGPGVSTITPPKFNNWDTVRLFSVGNLNGNISSFPIASSSSRGPSICGGEGSLLIKPEVSAPGSNVRSSVPGGYSNFSGTSMAAPHVSGAILLLKQAFPYLTGEELMLALYYTCADLGAPGEDNDYGMGLINVPAAYGYLLSRGHEPEQPATAPNDIILLRVEAPEKNCNLQVSPAALVENNGADTVYSIQFRYYLEGVGMPPAEQRWEGVLPPGGRETVRLQPLDAAAGEFELVAEVVAANEQADNRNLNNRLRRKARVIEKENIPAAIVGGVPVCRNGNALVKSLYEGEGAVKWYDAEAGGSLLGEGPALLAPVGSEPRTVYAQVTPVKKAGRPAIDEGGTAEFANTPAGLSFDAHERFILRSVKIYADQAGNRLLMLTDPEGNAFNKVVSVPERGAVRVELNLDIEPGEGYTLQLRAGKPLGFNTGGNAFPYEEPEVLTIKGSTEGPAFYYYFYDWEIEYDYYCGRTPVVVEPAHGEAPLAAFAASEQEVNLAEHSGEIAFFDGSDGAVAWLWDFGDGGLSTEPNPLHTYADTGSFRVTLTVVSEEGCSNSSEGVIVVIEDAVLVDDQAVASTEGQLSVYPNPAQDALFLSFELDRPARARYCLADLLGRPVLQGQAQLAKQQTISLSLAELPAGAYLLVADVDGNRLIRKVVKSR